MASGNIVTQRRGFSQLVLRTNLRNCLKVGVSGGGICLVLLINFVQM